MSVLPRPLAQPFAWPAETPLEPDLYLWLPINEGSGIVSYDVGGRNNHAAWYANPPWGIFGRTRAVTLNGTTQYGATSKNIELKSAITVMGWMKVNGSDSVFYKRVCETHYNTGFYLGRRDYDLSTTMPFCFIIVGTFLQPTLASTDVSLWRHYCGTWDGATIRGFLDAVDVGATASYTGSMTPDIMGIGKDMTGTSGYTIGSICGIRIYAKALSPHQINRIYAAEKALLP